MVTEGVPCPGCGDTKPHPGCLTYAIELIRSLAEPCRVTGCRHEGTDAQKAAQTLLEEGTE